MTNTLIGSRAWSRACHADDEVMAHDMNSSIWEYNAASDRTMNCKFGPDDAVGCGVEYSKGGWFVTLGGQVVGYSDDWITYQTVL
ncbi:uncharacterized protein FPRN_12174 [Fusarium proliferatum]|nr:uncharacterized protein FPRN_12174 [Fusarium proliferatum]